MPWQGGGSSGVWKTAGYPEKVQAQIYATTPRLFDVLGAPIVQGRGFNESDTPTDPVLDRGRGMPEEIMRHALVPFYTTKPSGSGLGLPQCNEIIEAHHGRMHLHGREGGGTVVTCWLP